VNLIFLSSADNGQVVELKEEGTRLGRIQDEADIFLDDVEVSGHHAVVEKVGRLWRVYDLNSTNGTFVNNRRIAGSAKLKIGDTLRLGDTILVFTDETEPQAAPPREGNDTLAEASPREVAAFGEAGSDTRETYQTQAERLLPAEVGDAITEISQAREQIEAEVAKQVVGQQQFIHQVMLTILAGGHAIVSGGPGLGKTLVVATLARTMGLVWRRTRLTQDTQPDHLEKVQAANLLLAVGIDEAPKRTQAVLLEWLRDPSLNPDGHRVGRRPFHLLAALDPRAWGPNSLRHGDMDAFLSMIHLDPPSITDEQNIIALAAHARVPAIDRICDRAAVLEMQQLLANLPVDSAVASYAVMLARATRPECEESPAIVRESTAFGCSVRGGQALLECAKANAVLAGREKVTKDDVRAVAYPTLRHRLGMTQKAVDEGLLCDDMITAILEQYA